MCVCLCVFFVYVCAWQTGRCRQALARQGQISRHSLTHQHSTSRLSLSPSSYPNDSLPPAPSHFPRPSAHICSYFLFFHPSHQRRNLRGTVVLLTTGRFYSVRPFASLKVSFANPLAENRSQILQSTHHRRMSPHPPVYIASPPQQHQSPSPPAAQYVRGSFATRRFSQYVLLARVDI